MVSITVRKGEGDAMQVLISPDEGVDLEEAVSLLASGMAWVLLNSGVTEENEVDMYVSALSMGTKSFVRSALEGAKGG